MPVEKELKLFGEPIYIGYWVVQPALSSIDGAHLKSCSHALGVPWSPLGSLEFRSTNTIQYMYIA